MEDKVKTCTVADCDRKHYGRGYCMKHWARWRRFGDPLTVKTQWDGDKPLDLRFWSKVAITANPDRCWEWQGARRPFGHGHLKVDGKLVAAHRLSWQLASGRESVLHILHSCDNPPCVNPNHLREGTPADNMRDAIQRNRRAIGEDVLSAKLRNADIPTIRQLISGGVSDGTIGKRYGVAARTIRQIRQGTTWKTI